MQNYKIFNGLNFKSLSKLLIVFTILSLLLTMLGWSSTASAVTAEGGGCSKYVKAPFSKGVNFRSCIYQKEDRDVLGYTTVSIDKTKRQPVYSVKVYSTVYRINGDLYKNSRIVKRVENRGTMTPVDITAKVNYQHRTKLWTKNYSKGSIDATPGQYLIQDSKVCVKQTKYSKPVCSKVSSPVQKAGS